MISEEQYQEALNILSNGGESGVTYAREGARQEDLDRARSIKEQYEREN